MSVNLEKLDGHGFEDLIEKLLIRMGFKTEGRKPTADGGIDIVAISEEPILKGRYIIQCKKWQSPVSVPVIRDLYGVVNAENANKGVLITTSNFTADAIEFARDKPIELIDGARLDELIRQHSLSETTLGDKAISSRQAAAESLRVELSGLSDRYRRRINEVENSLNVLHSKGFGSESEKRTYTAYRKFTLEVMERIENRFVAVCKSTIDNMKSSLEASGTARQLGKHLQELAEYAFETWENIRRTNPPSEFARSHKILEGIAAQILESFLDFLHQVEESLSDYLTEKGKIDHSVTLKLHIPQSEWDELVSSWKDAYSLVYKRLRITF
ncbi:MAG: restriction endonuclease [Thaumarchaeota archaeon]|nr:restriction endonuclease [Nitrososphaerota archaeon]